MDIINPIKILVALVFFFGLVALDRSRPENRYLLLILAIATVTEILTSLLILADIRIGRLLTYSIILHHGMWLLLFRRLSVYKRTTLCFLVLFLIFAVVNLAVYEGINTFNYYTFVFGAILYILAFILETGYHFRKEHLEVFQSNKFLLLACPLIFMAGVTLMFGFRSAELTRTEIFKGITLFDTVIYIVNIVYYLFIALYIRREKPLAYA